jgi:hypothetical protein
MRKMPVLLFITGLFFFLAGNPATAQTNSYNKNQRAFAKFRYKGPSKKYGKACVTLTKKNKPQKKFSLRIFKRKPRRAEQD